MTFDFVRLLKYLLEGLAVAVSAWYIPKRKSDPKEILLLGLVAAVTFALLDTFAPSIANGARQGTGFGLGFGLSGLSVPTVMSGGNKPDEDSDTDSAE